MQEERATKSEDILSQLERISENLGRIHAELWKLRAKLDPTITPPLSTIPRNKPPRRVFVSTAFSSMPPRRR